MSRSPLRPPSVPPVFRLKANAAPGRPVPRTVVQRIEKEPIEPIEPKNDDLDAEIVEWLKAEEPDKTESREDDVAEIHKTLKDVQKWAGQISELGDAIVAKYPPARYIYVGLGRSPATLILYLQSRGELAYHLPLGGLKLPPGRSMASPGMQNLTKAEKKNVTELIKKHIPSYKRRQGRKILLIDYVQSGEGLRVGKKLVKELIPTPWNRLRRGKVVPLGLHAFPKQAVTQHSGKTLKLMKLPGDLDEQGSVAALIGGSKLSRSPSTRNTLSTMRGPARLRRRTRCMSV